MARSHKIYFIKTKHGKVIACFTVKHECQTFLYMHTTLNPNDIDVYHAYDNQSGREITSETVDEFLKNYRPTFC